MAIFSLILEVVFKTHQIYQENYETQVKYKQDFL